MGMWRVFAHVGRARGSDLSTFQRRLPGSEGALSLQLCESEYL